MAQSPVLGHLSESVSGLVSIRAFRAAPRFCATLHALLDANQRARYNAQLASSWLSLRLQLLGALLLTLVALVAVLENHFRIVSPGIIALNILKIYTFILYCTAS